MDIHAQEALSKACAFVIREHASQTRKRSTIPYVSHLLQVAGSVMEHGGDLEQAVAALCHDTLEDCDQVDFAVLESEFGSRVARIVQDCTDTLDGDRAGKKSAWKTRKTRYLAHLAEADSDSTLVAACDKLHNLSSIVSDVRSQGLDYLERSSAEPHQQVWYFSTFLANTRDRLPERLVLRFEEELRAFRAEVGA